MSRIATATVRRVPAIAFVAALLGSFGCGGGDSGTTLPPLSCSDGGAAAANTVVLSCGAALDGTTERVDVVIGGPDSGVTTLRGLNFNVNYDPAKLEFVSADSMSPLFDPSALVIVKLLNGLQGTVVAGIQQVVEDDVVVAPGQHPVITLTFRTVAGAAFDPTPLTFDRAEATAPSQIVTFSSGLAVGYRP